MPLDLDELRKAAEAKRAARAAKRAPIEEQIEAQRLADEIAMSDAADAAGLTIGIDCKMIFADNTGRGCLVKCPSQVVYQAFTQKVLADKCGPQDRVDFAKAVVVWPTWKDMQSNIDATPGIVLKIAEVGGNLARAEEAEIEGK